MNIDFREPNEFDLPQIARWIAKDSCPQHNDVDPRFWIPEVDDAGERKVGTKTIAVTCDGEPVFFIKLENIMRCYIQFAPEDERDKSATSIGLKKAFLTIAAGAKSLGYREMIYESKSESLIDFFSKFKFEEVKNNFSVRI